MLTSVARRGEVDIDQEVNTAWAAFDTEWSGYSTSRRQRIPNKIADKI